MGTRQSNVDRNVEPAANAGDGAAREAPWPNMTSCRSECSCISFPSESLTVPPPGATSARGILHDSFRAQAERKNNARRRYHKGSKRCVTKDADLRGARGAVGSLMRNSRHMGNKFGRMGDTFGHMQRCPITRAAAPGVSHSH
jgi:hypothetical protein